jgi:polynucleotide 5'-hydroxyl-kinase GRC3/NOL9
MICGPKSSGKSTFAKILTNKLISDANLAIRSPSINNQASEGVALLDLDPGQPEYSIPGQLSLIHLQQPNFGPPFSHPWPGGTSRFVRSHTIGAITPAQDLDLYMQCALDLAAHYHNLLFQYPRCPLVINTPGWVLGSGLELLVELIIKLRPSDIVYMSQEGPWDVVNSLRSAANNIPVYTLPSQTCEYTTRTAAHLRSMQTMSYFHFDYSSTGEDDMCWSSLPLTSVPPWEIKYAGKGAGILGILSYGEQPSADCIIDSINGSVVAVVVIDDVEAIPGLRKFSEEKNDNGKDRTGVAEYSNSAIHLPLIVYALESELPYFNPLNSFTISPQHSHCIGLALVRGIDITRRRLQVLTPLSSDYIREINEEGKQIVLVSGKFDTPGWAYTEDMVKRMAINKEGTKEKSRGEKSDGVEDSEAENRPLGSSKDVPWVERLEGSQGRGVGSRVWRVRRDLGRQDGVE